MPGCAIDKTIDPARPGTVLLSISQPDPSSPADSVPYNGVIRGLHRIERWAIDKNQWALLKTIGFMVARCEFTVPIEPSEARWMRWKVRPTSPIHPNDMRMPERIVRKMLNLLVYRFEVIGPIDVRHRFEEWLCCILKRCISHAPHHQERATECSDLIESFGRIFKSGSSVIKDWRVHVFIPDAFRLSCPLISGDIAICGDFPNEIEFPGGELKRSWQWKAGERNIDQRNKGFFTIQVLLSHISIISRMIPWVSLIVGLLAFLTRGCSCP
jgi:hypothetical protein